MREMNKDSRNMEDEKKAAIRVLEKGTVKVQYEVLNKQYRQSQRALEKEVHLVTKATDGLQRARTVAEVDQLLSGVMENLSRLKRKAAACVNEEMEAVQACKRRVDHLRSYELLHNETSERHWRRQRLDRCVVNYLLRQGYYNTAECLVERTPGLTELTQLELFRQSRVVEEALLVGKTAQAIQWCNDHRSKLRKIGSNFEFRVRLQEFIELVKSGSRLEAVRHARKFMSPWVTSSDGGTPGIPRGSRGDDEDDDLTQANVEDTVPPADLVQRAMLLLALPSSKLDKKMMAELDDWPGLVRMFRGMHRQVYSFESSGLNVFGTAIQAGLAAMKTHQCYKDKNSEQLSREGREGAPGSGRPVSLTPGAAQCPVCHPVLNEFARDLPFAHSAQSKLVCGITGLPMNEHNPPMCLPNGHVYSQKALLDLMLENDGKIVCPRTEMIYDAEAAQKVFIM